MGSSMTSLMGASITSEEEAEESPWFLDIEILEVFQLILVVFFILVGFEPVHHNHHKLSRANIFIK